MRIDLPLCSFKECRNCFDGNCRDYKHADRCEYRELADNEWRYRWHNIVKNPFDLPVHNIPKDQFYLLLDFTDGVPIIGYYRNGEFQHKDGRRIPLVKAWKEVELFEEWEL